jgi:hypothetical protein
LSEGGSTGDHPSFSWFGPRRQNKGIPQRRQRKVRTPFNWTSDLPTRTLLQRRSGFNDNFVALFTGSPLPPSKPGKLLVVSQTDVARDFVDHVTANIRNLSTTLIADREITSGELRGPISWAETLSVRSTSFGLDYTHVCTIQKRTYDSPENRVIVAALNRIAESVPDLWRTQALAADDPAIATALDAAHLLKSKPLNQVKVQPVSKLTMAKKRARNTRKTGFYDLALAVLDLPPRESSSALAHADDILVLCDPVTLARHTLVLEIENKLVSMGLEPNAELVVTGDALQLGNTNFKAGVGGFVELSGTRIGVAGFETEADVLIAHPDDLSHAIVSTLRKRAL